MNAFSPEKILVHYDKLKNPENTYPITFTIDPTNYCNHDCDFCLNGSQRKQFTKELPLETIKDILELSKKIGVKGIKIAGGGEPLMYSKINDLLDLLACYDLDYALVTNGSLLFKIDIEKLKIFKYINVSAETFNPDAYKSIRKVDSTKQLLLGIKKFNTFNLKTKLNLSCLLHDNSTPYLYETIESAKILGFNSVKIKNLANTDSYITIQKNSIQSLDSRDFVVSINDSKFEFTYNRCQAVYLGGVWAADGKFHICCDRRNDKLYLFDFINDGVHKFQEYWQSDKHKELVNSIRPKTDCPNCSYDYYNRVIFDLQKNDLFENLL